MRLKKVIEMVMIIIITMMTKVMIVDAMVLVPEIRL